MQQPKTCNKRHIYYNRGFLYYILQRVNKKHTKYFCFYTNALVIQLFFSFIYIAKKFRYFLTTKLLHQ